MDASARGFMSLMAILDWFSRSVLAWRLSSRLDGRCCLDGVEEAFQKGRPEIFHTDQGVRRSSILGRMNDPPYY
jgi:putative transposase